MEYVAFIVPLQNIRYKRKKRYKRKEERKGRYKTHRSSSLQKICKTLESGTPVTAQGKKSVTKVSLILYPLPSGMARYKTCKLVKL